MKRLLVSFATIAALILGSAGSASADVIPIGSRDGVSTDVLGQSRLAPNYGYRFTARHGWIVWADNDRYFPIRTRCRWFAFGTYWHTSWIIYPGDYKWTTSDAGQWGNRRPTGLRCSYVRTY